jgi:hypothetical protein
VRGNHEIGSYEPAARSEQATDQCCRDGKRGIGHDPERPPRQSQVGRVRHDDDDAGAPEPVAQKSRPPLVQLDRHDASSGVDERQRERAVAGSDVEHELTRSNGGILDHERRPTAIELVEPPPCGAPTGHGGP